MIIVNFHHRSGSPSSRGAWSFFRSNHVLSHFVVEAPAGVGAVRRLDVAVEERRVARTSVPLKLPNLRNSSRDASAGDLARPLRARIPTAKTMSSQGMVSPCRLDGSHRVVFHLDALDARVEL